MSARGLYEASLNGRRVGDAELAPGWTDYRHRVTYQTYDVTAQVTAGVNALAVTLAGGWWSGFVGFDPRRAGAHYGTDPELSAELHVEHADGSVGIVVTDSGWRSRRGPIRYADLLMGECHDRRADEPGWDRAGFDDSAWRPAVPGGSGQPEPATAQPVRAMTALAPATITRTGTAAHLVDFGQNFAGRVRVTARGLTPGSRILLRHGEALDDQGALYTANLRTATATDVLVAGDSAVETFEPRFTYHGFRYVEVDGVADLDPSDITGVVLHSDTPWAGTFACSDPAVEQLHRNISWGQRANFVSVPTDCPQRDERLGWLADAQVFLPTACLNADVAAFFASWLRELRDAQQPDGGLPNVAPRLAGVAEDGAPGWADAGVLLPWHLYRVYGDERFLSCNLSMMGRWVEFVHRNNPDLIWRHRVGPHFADWLAPEPTPRDLVATAYFAHSAELTARAARVVGDARRAVRYSELAERIRATFNTAFVAADGQLGGDTQTGYLLALAFELLPEALRSAAADRLVKLIEDRGLRTGFLGVGLVAPVLDEFGHPELAHGLLRRTDLPSWLYPLRHGATTIWERWDGYTDEHGFQTPSMNSFNHYALGSIGEWLYRGVAGIDQAPDSAGYRDLVIRPRPGDLDWARASYLSVRGAIEVAWTRHDDQLRLDVTVPPGAAATVHVPTSRPETVREADVPAGSSPGVEIVGTGPATLLCRVGAGRYRFTATGPWTVGPETASPTSDQTAGLHCPATRRTAT